MVGDETDGLETAGLQAAGDAFEHPGVDLFGDADEHRIRRIAL
jgi:hypothetical protein